MSPNSTNPSTHSAAATKGLSTAKLVCRIALVVVGGYALTATITGVLTFALIAFGTAASEATLFSAILAFLVYLVCLIWGFQERRFAPLLVVFVFTPAALYTLVLLAQRSAGVS